MSDRPDEAFASSGSQEEPTFEIRPWREVGWIFRDGDVYAIERQGEETRTRSTRVSHMRDE